MTKAELRAKIAETEETLRALRRELLAKLAEHPPANVLREFEAANAERQAPFLRQLREYQKAERASR